MNQECSKWWRSLKRSGGRTSNKAQAASQYPKCNKITPVSFTVVLFSESISVSQFGTCIIEQHNSTITQPVLVHCKKSAHYNKFIYLLIYDSGLLGRDTVSLGYCFLKCLRNATSSSSLEDEDMLFYLKVKKH
jgi:hypothetical protein